ncbi:MAG: glycosyltransferase [Candidatus Binatia bacterium]
MRATRGARPSWYVVMRIAFVTDTYENGIGGGVVTALRFVEALRRWHDVTVIATGSPAPGKVVVPAIRLPIRAMRENRFTFGRPVRAILEKAFSRADIVHVQFPFPLGLRAIRLARGMGVPAVAAFHVQPENLLFNLGLQSPRLSGWVYRRWVRGFFQLADEVVCPSRFAAERLQSFGLSVQMTVISNGAPGRMPRDAVRLPAGGIESHLVLSVGRLAREKRQDVIIDAVARSRHRERIRLVIAGAGPLERALRKRARRHGLAVEFGYVSQERLVQLYDSAHVFVHASEVELEGMAVVEAIAAGLPVLVADASESAARQFAVGPQFLFRPGDPADLAARLDHLLESPDALAVAARRCVERAAQHDFERSVQQLSDVYERVLAGAGRPRQQLAP